MLRLALSSIRARPLRAVLSGIGVLVGVTLVAGTMIFTDTIHRALHDTFANATRGTDAIVSGRSALGATGQAPTVSPRVLARIAQLADVQQAAGQVSDTAALVGRDGKVLDVVGGRTRALSYLGPPFQELRIVAGRPPHGPREVAIDRNTAALEGLRLGQRISIATEQPKRSFRIVGLARFGGASKAGAAIVAFDVPTAQALFSKGARFDAVLVAARPHVPASRLAREIAPLLGSGLVVRTAPAQVDEDVRRLSDQLSFLNLALGAIALVALSVGAFVIFNSLSISVAQRTRELGLLRALGASRRQLLWSVIAQALTIGLVASIGAIGLGLAAAAGIRGLVDSAGFRLPSTGPVLEPRTVAVCLGLGLVVTLLTGLAPALRASRVPAMAALREGVELPRSPLADARPWVALGLGTAGVAVTIHGVIAGSAVTPAVCAVLALVIAVALLSPVILPAATRIVARPLTRATGVNGRLASENAMRQQAAGGTAASAVMVGLAVVVFVTIFANEARSSIRDAVAHSFAGDIAITAQNGVSPIPTAAAGAVAAVPGVEVASVLKRSRAGVQAAGDQPVNGLDTQTIGTVYRFDWTAGDDSLLGLLGPNGALVERSLARRADLRVGSHFIATSPAGKSTQLTVRGIYRDPGLLPGFSVQMPTFNDVFHEPRARRILVKLASGTDPLAVQRSIDRSLTAFPQAQTRSESQLASAEAGRLHGVLYLFYALLALSVVVAGVGIVNTLTLEVHERTRELGMLRAIGASRRSLQRIVAYESLIIVTIGGLLGLAFGTVFAVIVTTSLSGSGLAIDLPWAALIGLLAVTLVAGCAAALAPARRASRLDILRAIAYE